MPSASSRRTSLAGRLALALGGLAVGLLTAEVGLRLAVDEVDDYFLWRPGLHMVFHPRQEFVPGVEGAAHFRVGSLGLRSEELSSDHDYRVLAVGGSTAECNYLDQSDAWPLLLASELNARQSRRNVWSGIVAKSGLNSRHNVVQLEELLPRLPRIDLVVVLEGVNDLTLRLSQDEDYDPRYMEREGSRRELIARSFQLYPTQPGAPWVERTALWSLMKSLRRLRPPRKLELDEGGQIYDVWRQHRRSARSIRHELPDLTSALAEFRRHLVVQAELARAHGAEVLFLTQPSLWRRDLPPELEARLWFGGVGDFQKVPGCDYYSVEALARGMDAYNAVTVEVARSQGAGVFDLAAELPRQGDIFYDDVHFTIEGSRRVAERLTDYLLTQEPLAEP